jgi:hypothetical protein
VGYFPARSTEMTLTKKDFQDVTLVDQQHRDNQVEYFPDSVSKLKDEGCSFECTKCVIKFNNEEALDNHSENDHVPLQDIMDVDKKASIAPQKEWVTNNTADLTEMLEAIPKEVLNKDIELVEIESRQNLLEILNDKEESPKIENQVKLQHNKCTECNFKTGSETNLRLHKKQVHELTLFKCDECGVNTRTINSLKNHILRKHKGTQIDNLTVNTYNCELCDRTLPTELGRKIHTVKMHPHMAQHEKCDKCDLTFTSKAFMKIHKDKIHKGRTLKRHIEDTSEKEYLCQTCNVNYRSKSGLKIHSQTMHHSRMVRTQSIIKSPPSKKVKGDTDDKTHQETNTIGTNTEELSVNGDICLLPLSHLDLKAANTELRTEIVNLNVQLSSLRTVKENKNNIIQKLLEENENFKVEVTNLMQALVLSENPVMIQEVIEENTRVTKENIKLKQDAEYMRKHIKALKEDNSFKKGMKLFECNNC